MKKYYLEKVTAGADTSCLVFEIDTQKPEELKAINDRIERWNDYSFNHGHVTVTSYISEITAEEAKNYTIFKAADYFPELAQN